MSSRGGGCGNGQLDVRPQAVIVDGLANAVAGARPTLSE